MLVDLIKISHHGSKHNTNKNLLERFKCNKYLISTDSSGPYYHPNRETIILISEYGRKNIKEHIYIYSNYNLNLDKILSKSEQQTLNITFEEVEEIELSIEI